MPESSTSRRGSRVSKMQEYSLSKTWAAIGIAPAEGLESEEGGRIVLEGLPIYLLGPSLKIYFSFLVVGLGCMCYGPCVGMMAGAIIDSVGFLLSSYGEPYFPGYLVTAVLSGFIYGVLLYKRKPTLLRIIVVRLIINYGSNVLLGSVWKAMLYGKGYLYYLTSGAIKNTLMLPVEVFLMWAVLNAAVNYGLDRKYIHKR